MFPHRSKEWGQSYPSRSLGVKTKNCKLVVWFPKASWVMRPVKLLFSRLKPPSVVGYSVRLPVQEAGDLWISGNPATLRRNLWAHPLASQSLSLDNNIVSWDKHKEP